MTKTMAKLADVMFVLDTTGSMRNAIEAVKNVIGQLADIYSEASIETRLGIIQFRDRVLTHGQDEGTNRTLERAQFDEGDFTQDPNEFRDVLAFYKAAGGGPLPESSMDALAHAAESAWREEATRIIIHITDAPPRVPDYRMREMEEVTNLLSRNHIGQLHMVIDSEFMEQYDDLVEVKTDGIGGNQYATVTWVELRQDVEDIIEDLRDIARTSSEIIGFSPTPSVERAAEENPFESEPDNAGEAAKGDVNPFDLE